MKLNGLVCLVSIGVLLTLPLTLPAIIGWVRALLLQPTAPLLRHTDLLKIVLRLGPEKLEPVFLRYRELYGAGAAVYARRTAAKWQTGQVRPLRSTAQRFLVQLPEAMGFDLKCEILRQLRAEFCAQDSYEITVTREDWREKLPPLVESMLAKAQTTELPLAVREQLSWLAGAESRAAEKLLAATQELEGRQAVALLSQELAELEKLAQARSDAKITHKIRLPCGTITVRFKHG